MEVEISEFRFGNVRVDAAQRRVLIDEQPAKLGGRAFDVLLALIERRERIVSKNELFELLWPDVVVEENNLQVHISTLRKLLGPSVISTIPGRGYRFSAVVDSPATDATRAVVAPSAPSTALPPGNLPPQHEPLYGRDDDLRGVSELLSSHRHVSIVGAGGIGKTRLALAVANARCEQFHDGVWWVELASLSDGALVAGAIGQALGVQAQQDRPVLKTVASLLGGKASLLVLDNCEHLADAVVECVQALLRDAAGLRVLVTTQEALHTPEERVHRLSGLATVSSNADSPAAAVELFIVRAKAADPRLQLGAPALAAIEGICRKLDGMPLAIELAAARVRLLGIEGVHARLDERFQVLTGGTRTVLRRHQTLRAALEWSHGLLTPDEQTVLRRLGAFVGGFTLELAQNVASDHGIDRWAVLDVLGQLVDKSLVVAEGEDPPRYRLLETMRAFTLEQLAAAGETPAMMRRHAEVMRELLWSLDTERWSLSFAQAMRLAAELDNLRAALEWAESPTGDRLTACALFGSSHRIWKYSGRWNEGIDRGLRMQPLPEALDPQIEARYYSTLGTLCRLSACRVNFDAALHATELNRRLGNTARLIDDLTSVALIGSRLGEVDRAAIAIAEAETLIRSGAYRAQAGELEWAKSLHYMALGQYEPAMDSMQRMGEICREQGPEFEWVYHLARAHAAWYACGLARYDSAIDELHGILDALRGMYMPAYGVGEVLSYLACAHALRGDRDEALKYGAEAVPELQRTDDPAWLLLFIALVHARDGAGDRALRLIGFFDRKVPLALPMLTQVRTDVIRCASAKLGPTEVERLIDAGRELNEQQALKIAFG